LSALSSSAAESGFFPDGVRLDLALVEEPRFGNGVVVLRYAVPG
jgi:hypothetical protein